jgi:hypothetical protein
MYSKISKQFSELTAAAETYPLVSKTKEPRESEFVSILKCSYFTFKVIYFKGREDGALPKVTKPLRTLDVFAGCGGLSQGLHQVRMLQYCS